MKIALLSVSIGFGYSVIVRPGKISKRKYCKKHGYDFHYLRKLIDHSRAPSWQKIKLIQQLLPNYDWIFWSDADSLIMNPSIKLESFIDTEHDFILTKDLNGINCGQFFIKNSPLMNEFLEEVYRNNKYNFQPNWEQEAIIEILADNSRYRSATKFLPQRAFNSYDPDKAHFDLGRPMESAAYQKGDFIIHLAGSTNKELFTLMKKYSRKKIYLSFLVRSAYLLSYLLAPFHVKPRRALVWFLTRLG